MKKSGAWYTYDGEQLGQGRENAKQFLAENPEVMVEICEQVRQQAGLTDTPDTPAELSELNEFSDADEAPITLD